MPVSPHVPPLCALQDVQAAAHAGGRGALDAAVLHRESPGRGQPGQAGAGSGAGWGRQGLGSRCSLCSVTKPLELEGDPCAGWWVGHRALPPLTSCAHASPGLVESHGRSCGNGDTLIPCQAGHSSIPSQGDCTGVPHHPAGSLPGGEILCPSSCCPDLSPELLIPCSNALNDPAGGWQWP